MPGEVTLREVIDSDLPIFFEQQNDPQANRMAAFPAREWEPFMAHWASILADDSNVIRTILFDGGAVSPSRSIPVGGRAPGPPTHGQVQPNGVAGNIVSFVLHGRQEVGYWLGRDFWGRGIATQALAQFLEIVSVRPLYGIAVRHNVGSIRVLQKCGFQIQSYQPILSGIPGEEGLEEVILKLDAEPDRDTNPA
jgi:RimJ/RimL family protein N-acetyltransferase